MKSSHSQPFICIDILLTVAEIPPGMAMAASSQHIGLDNTYTEDMDMWWASNYSNLIFIHNAFVFNETSLFDEVTNSTLLPSWAYLLPATSSLSSSWPHCTPAAPGKVLLQNAAWVSLTQPAVISAVTCVPPAVSAAPAGAAAVSLPAQRCCSIMCWMSVECTATIVLGHCRMFI